MGAFLVYPHHSQQRGHHGCGDNHHNQWHLSPGEKDRECDAEDACHAGKVLAFIKGGGQSDGKQQYRGGVG